MSIDQLFTAVKDEEWHSLSDLSNQLGLSIDKLVKLSKLFSEHGLMKFEERAHRIKIEPLWKLLLPLEEEQAEQKMTVATFILPPQTSVEVQSTQISNNGNIELEVTLRMNNKIKEVAVATV